MIEGSNGQAGICLGYHLFRGSAGNVIAQYPDLDWSFLDSTSTLIPDVEDSPRVNLSYPAKLLMIEADQYALILTYHNLYIPNLD
ncbi:hypothetical protein PanWU01x14_187260 [Parasponia andersonii]|uniref:Uncharacterized protein n=1 Tax=Parasponia andersonii TaxID=3476 RepID=A0A2P5C3E4_PARAD|nr:hypothetical protein PanWU01x14_187260 [Parasponia andersonii]